MTRYGTILPPDPVEFPLAANAPGVSEAMNQRNDSFFEVDQSIATTSEGDVALPMLFYDASLMLGLFHVDASKLTEAIGGVGVEPALDMRGRGVVGLAFYEYRDASIASYNEVGLAAQVVRKGSKPPKFPLVDMVRKPASRKSYNYLFHLPVTTRSANAAGREIWGFPKFVAEIPLNFDGSRFEGSILESPSATPILKYSGSRGRGLSLPGMDLCLYTELDDQPMETVVDTNYKGYVGTGGNMTLKVGKSDHPMAQTLRKLDLDGKSPFLTHMAEGFRSRLNAATALS
ncbi:MAG: acetoacetate decarboxylase family protein [Actinomycetia bacterium]|nr:acetoacetate decarboxylase family protein [Actinomycetes bacterium]